MEEVDAVFDRWKSTMGHPRARLDLKRAKAIRSMLAVGYSVEDLQLAIFGCSISPFHQGQNDRSQKYEDIGLICRDAEHVDKFIALAEAHTRRARKYDAPRAPVSAVPDNVMALVKRG
jgi:hypothetical protein